MIPTFSVAPENAAADDAPADALPLPLLLQAVTSDTARRQVAAAHNLLDLTALSVQKTFFSDATVRNRSGAKPADARLAAISSMARCLPISW
jgi:hypothetical protein